MGLQEKLYALKKTVMDGNVSELQYRELMKKHPD
jgi:hypothetical protein